MVHLLTLENMRKYRDENLKEWVKNHPGEFFLIESGSPFNVSFYKTELSLNNATKKYEGLFGPTYLVERVPKNYRKPDSLMDLRELSQKVRMETEDFLRKMDNFESRS